MLDATFPSRSTPQNPNKTYQTDYDMQSKFTKHVQDISPNINFDFEENSPFQRRHHVRNVSKSWIKHSFKNLKN